MNHHPRPQYEFGPFRLDSGQHALFREGQPVPLTPKVIDLLEVLVRNEGRLVEKDELLKEIWPDSFVEEGNLNRNISILRKALGEDDSGGPYIETVPKRGYRFAASVREVPPNGSGAEGGELTKGESAVEEAALSEASAERPLDPKPAFSRRLLILAGAAALALGIAI